MRPFLQKRKNLWLCSAITMAMMLACFNAPILAQQQTPPDQTQSVILSGPDLLMPAVGRNTALRVAGQFSTLMPGGPTPVIEGQLRLWAPQTEFFDVFRVPITVSRSRTAGSDPRVVFTGVFLLESTGFFDTSLVGSASLALRCLNCARGGLFHGTAVYVEETSPAQPDLPIAPYLVAQPNVSYVNPF